jgi:hypothetical protein
MGDDEDAVVAPAKRDADAPDGGALPLFTETGERSAFVGDSDGGFSDVGVEGVLAIVSCRVVSVSIARYSSGERAAEEEERE